MTAPIVLHPKKSDTEAPKHFEQVWEESEKLFDADKLNVESILNELQAKVSLYRLLGTGSFEAQDLGRTKTLLIGKIIMTLTKLSLKDNLNTFEALQVAIEDHKLIQMETSVSGGDLDKLMSVIQTKAAETPNGVNASVMKQVEEALKKLTEVATSTS
jgi:hypothetical protein